MDNLSKKFEGMIVEAKSLENLPLEILYSTVSYSLIKAGLSIIKVKEPGELKRIEMGIPQPYRSVARTKLYLSALDLVKSLNSILEDKRRAVILEEANLQYIIDSLKIKVGKVDEVLVLDCTSVPEFMAIAIKLGSRKRSVNVLEEIFVNPVGVTRFLTGQLKALGVEERLANYAKLLKERLGASSYDKSSTVDLIVHKHGFALEEFLRVMSTRILKVFDKIERPARLGSVLVTSDHGYDVIADEHGLYITHGYYGEGNVLSFSRVALFMVVG
ncbi:MAG: hypothetical protein P3X22_001010 [Thermoprotei archaeon]|nr:hypothetical protein [Thermoprotei archaeon]